MNNSTVSPLNIVMVGEDYLPQRGGLEISTSRLAKAIAKIGHRVRVVTRGDSSPSKREEFDGYEVHRIQTGLGCSFLGTAFDLDLLQDADFIYMFGVGHDKSLSHWKTLQRLPKIPKGIKIGSPGDISKYVRNNEISTVFDVVFCLNDEIREEAYIQNFPPNKTFLVRNGIDTSFWSSPATNTPSTRASLGLGCKDFVVGVHARVAEKKNLGHLVDVCSELVRRGKPVRLLMQTSYMYSDAFARNQLAEAISRAPQGMVVVRGSHECVRETISCFDLYVSCSKNEGLSNSLLEVLASGRPALVTDIAGHQSVLGSDYSGYFSAQATVGQVADKIEALMRVPEKMEKIELEAKKILHDFDIETVADEYLQVIFGILDGRRLR